MSKVDEIGVIFISEECNYFWRETAQRENVPYKDAIDASNNC